MFQNDIFYKRANENALRICKVIGFYIGRAEQGKKKF